MRCFTSLVPARAHFRNVCYCSEVKSLTRGREFTARDNSAGAPAVMTISESLARVLWPEYPKGANPVGRHISVGYDK
jgi:hypothetical protein